MNTPRSTGPSIEIHAYLSYRCKIKRDRQARDRLKALCSEHGITLRYDERETEEGDSLIEFMDDLSAARCVFVFLSPEYFQSAYTLFELIRINEWTDLDQRFILPLRITESMVTYEWTRMKSYFDQNEAVRNELERLLKKYHLKHDNLWQRLNKVWEAIIFPHLDRLNKSLEQAGEEQATKNLLNKTKGEAAQTISNSTEELHQTVIQKMTEILNRKRINADDTFREELGLSQIIDASNIAGKLVNGREVGEAIALLTRILEEKKSLLDTSSYEWKSCFFDVEQLCGWLLINSVDPVWWFHNEIRLKRSAETGISCNYLLDDANYIEVVISWRMLRNARYKLDINNQPKPANQHDCIMFFDASPSAVNEELLIDIYEDLYGVKPASEIDLYNNIVKRVRTLVNKQHRKPIYYLVSPDFFRTLVATDWFPRAEQQLAGCLQFICCDKPVKPDGHQASIVDQAQLLDQVAYLISLEH